MRILLTVHQFLPDHATGTEVLTYQVAKELVRLGHEVRIITGYPMKRAPERRARFDNYEYQGLRISRYFHQESAAVAGQSNIAELEYDNHLCRDWVRSLLEAWRPEVVHFFHLKNLSATSIDVCRDMHIPMVLTPTDFWLICPTTQLLLPDGALCAGPDGQGVNCLRHALTNTQPPVVNRFFAALPDAWVSGAIRVAGAPGLRTLPPFSWANALARRTSFLRQRVGWLDCIVAPTRFMQELLRENGMSPKKLLCSRFGIDLTAFEPPSSERGSHDALRVGFIGSLSHPKGAHVLVDAVRRIPGDIPLRVEVYGNSRVYPAYAQALADSAASDARIRFCGTFPNETIGAVLSNIDVLIVPSVWYENTPLVIYSAQAAGCPVVASNLGGMSEVIRERVDGLLFPPGDSDALASIIEKLCRDRGLLSALARNSPQPKSIENYTDELTTVYRDVLVANQTTRSASP